MDKSSTKIQGMFSDIAPSYDRANSFLSLGIHHLWKQKMVRLSEVGRNQSVLDCASGTGDLALLFKKQVGKNGKVIATDFCKDMLDIAPHKAKNKTWMWNFKWPTPVTYLMRTINLIAHQFHLVFVMSSAESWH